MGKFNGTVRDANTELNKAINDLIGISGDLAAELGRLEEAFREEMAKPADG